MEEEAMEEEVKVVVAMAAEVMVVSTVARAAGMEVAATEVASAQQRHW